MLNKHKCHWINDIKHVFILLILLNHMIELGSAESSGIYIENNDDMINSELNTLSTVKEKLNNIASTVCGKFHSLNFTNTESIEKFKEMLQKMKQIEQYKNAIDEEEGDINEDIEKELEKIRESHDNIFNKIEEDHYKLEESLTEMRKAYKDIAERLATTKEVYHFLELLLKGDYREAKKSADLISNDTKIIDVMKTVYEEKKDFNGYLYFAGIVNNLSRRLSIYRYIYNDIILKNDYEHIPENDTDSSDTTPQPILICNGLKLLKKLESTIINIAPTSADVYASANNLTADCKTQLENVFKTNKGIQKLIQHYKGLDKFTINDTKLIYTTFNNSIINRKQILFQVKYYLDNVNNNIIDCWIDTNILLLNRDSMKHVVFRDKNDIDSEELKPLNNTVKLNSDEIDFINNLKLNNYDLALTAYNKFKSNNKETVNTLKEYYNKYHDIDSILYFSDYLTLNDRITYYNSFFNAINTSDVMNICDLLKFHDRLINLDFADKLLFIDYLKNDITDLIYADTIRALTYSNATIIEKYIIEAHFNTITIRSKKENKVIGKFKYYLEKENGKNYCYYDGKVSINNYDAWYWNSGLFAVSAWIAFVSILTKYCPYLFNFKP